ncbi:hypothetical protein PLEOSDRAFT_1098672 [Pleurotus ostreatus PC15]|uniref:DUF6533 domain-containing protein n=1 Tax=Pleurotus ostreatus (strain PC15) TaxID=1137138 RepID=A0A067NX85_PLEO1|nr:hypothetical protein PLEOSDRAFT_1098672 [Pleurotus ostreatus PC15]
MVVHVAADYPVSLGVIHDWDATVRNHASLAALTVLVYEYFTTLSTEVAVIWRGHFSVTKALFLVLRYGALALQIGSQTFFAVAEQKYPVPKISCLAWHSCQTVVFQILLLSVEYIQVRKVYAIYSEYRNYFICLRIFRVFNFALVSFTTVSTLRILSYDGACLVGNIPWHVACFGALASSTQVILTFLTVCPKVMWRSHSAVLSIVTRDTFLTCAGLLAMCIIISTHASVLAHVIPTFFISLLSICGCRMVTNLLSAETTEEPPPDRGTICSGPVQLTSFLSLEEGMPSLTRSRSDLMQSPIMYPGL